MIRKTNGREDIPWMDRPIAGGAIGTMIAMMTAATIGPLGAVLLWGGAIQLLKPVAPAYVIDAMRGCRPAERNC